MCSDDSVTHWFEQIREGDSIAARAIWERYYPELVRLARESGVAILAGTDRRFGPLLHWELEMFARAGVPPIEVIQAATLNPAQATGVEADLGSIEVGKLADLVVLDADPLTDITNTLRVWRVMRGGHVYDPEALESRAVD